MKQVYRTGSSTNVSGSSPDEFCSSDEVKVFKDEGEDESEQNASECLQAELLEEEKSSLIKESEQVGKAGLIFE
jgi:transcription factor 7-like 2